MNMVIVFIHLIFAVVFAGFIVLDRVFFRLIQKPDNFYHKAKPILAISAFGLVISGSLIIYQFPELLHSFYFIIKLSLGLILFVLFFMCPKIVARLQPFYRKIYRIVVVLLLFCVLFLSILNQFSL